VRIGSFDAISLGGQRTASMRIKTFAADLRQQRSGVGYRDRAAQVQRCSRK
jgi:hypothetical protein